MRRLRAMPMGAGAGASPLGPAASPSAAALLSSAASSFRLLLRAARAKGRRGKAR